ncbi:U1 small nuclear ribonucleoprotein A-like [Hylaeus volcanicus]|uniref:U1 small nuclear ribonucleoprotein A-like n=1 Tax=Hylaeus volcanicus TaxID=313075 RepID=UPI0023B871EA|nr:U1 small nuclear ribonucleoprotein A-like [Hylaeus volcanicus]
MSGNTLLKTVDVPPNQTLFCYNLTTKVKIQQLRSCLFEFFSPHGKIIDVIASKRDPKKRGNAFIVFSNIVGATTSLRSLQGKIFLGRQLHISYAKTKSDKVALLDGTYRMKKPLLTSEISTKFNNDKDEDLHMPKVPAQATLFVQNLPDTITETALTILFKQYPGFQEVRLIQGRAIAFVDFGNELQAEIAIKGLDNFLVTPDKALKLSFVQLKR